MKIALTSWGSLGDVQPLIVLAQALQRAGHEPRLGAPDDPRFAAVAAELSVPFQPLGPALDAEALAGMLATSLRHGAMQAFRAYVKERLYAYLDTMYQRALTLAEGCDLVVSSITQPAGRMAAETLSIPIVSVTWNPLQIPTAYNPPAGLPRTWKWLHQALWRLVGRVANSWWAGDLNAARARAGLALQRDPFGDGYYAPDLNLIAASRHLMPSPPDWARRHRFAGFWYMHESEWTPPSDLVAFIKAGEPPLLVTFGSMTPPEPQRTALWGMVTGALRALNLRCIVQLGEPLQGLQHAEDSVYQAQAVPHGWLMPRVQAVVHHGGAGTVAAAFQSGTPSVVVPFLADNFDWGRLAHRLAVAPPAVPFTKLTESKLQAAIAAVVGNRVMRDRATGLAEAISQEAGPETAVGMLETFMETTATASA